MMDTIKCDTKQNNRVLSSSDFYQWHKRLMKLLDYRIHNKKEYNNFHSAWRTLLNANSHMKFLYCHRNSILNVYRDFKFLNNYLDKD